MKWQNIGCIFFNKLLANGLFLLLPLWSYCPDKQIQTHECISRRTHKHWTITIDGYSLYQPHRKRALQNCCEWTASTWVGVPDGGLEQTLAVLAVPGGDNLEAGAVAVPRCETLRVLGCHARGRSVRASEHNWHWHLERLSGKTIIGRSKNLTINSNNNRFNNKHCHVIYC